MQPGDISAMQRAHGLPRGTDPELSRSAKMAPETRFRGSSRKHRCDKFALLNADIHQNVKGLIQMQQHPARALYTIGSTSAWRGCWSKPRFQAFKVIPWLAWSGASTPADLRLSSRCASLIIEVCFKSSLRGFFLITRAS